MKKLEMVVCHPISEIKPEQLIPLVEDLTPVSEMAVLLAVSESELREALDDPNSHLYYHYRLHLAVVRRKIRHRNIELAEASSPTAAEKVEAYLDHLED